MASKSNSNNMFDSYDFGPILSQILENFGNNGGALANNEFTQDLFDKLDGIFENVNELSKKDINKAFDVVLAMLRSIYGNSSELTNAMKMAKDEVKALSAKHAISVKLMANMITGVVDRLEHASVQAAQRGEKGALNVSNPKDKASADKLALVFQTQLQKTADSLFDKFSSLFRDQENLKKTKTKHFIDDLVDGLARSKFVGGAFTDLIRLFTFFGANFLKNFGPIGKALAVGLVALGPVIATAIANAVGRALSAVIGNVVTGALSKIIGQMGGSATGSFFGTLFGMGAKGAATNGLSGLAARSIAGTVATNSVVTGIGTAGTTALATGISGIGGATVAGSTVTGIGTAVGGGVAASGAAGGGLLASLTAALGPILITLGVIAAAAGVIYLIAKNWDKLTKWCEETSDKLKDLGKSWLEAFQNWKDGLNDWLDEHPLVDKTLGGIAAAGGGIIGYSAYENMRGAIPKVTPQLGEDSVQYGKLKVGKYGEVLNAKELNQAELGRYMEAYRQQDKERFDRTYEIAPEGIASLSDFQRDAVMRDSENNGKKGAILYKGATQDLLELRKALIAGGMSEEKANKLMYTSGMLTGSGGHAVGGKHDSAFATGFDLVGKGWNQEDMTLADPIIKGFYKGVGQADYEIKKNGQYLFTTPDKGTNNALWDVTRSVGGSIPLSAVENEKTFEEWAQTKKKSIAVAPTETEKKAEGEKTEEKPKSLAEQNPDNKLLNNPLTKQMQKVANADGGFIDFTGNKTMSDVLKDALNMLHCQPRQQT